MATKTAAVAADITCSSSQTSPPLTPTITIFTTPTMLRPTPPPSPPSPPPSPLPSPPFSSPPSSPPQKETTSPPPPPLETTTSAETSPVANKPTKQLKRSIGLSHGIAVIIGLVVGGGIFITPRKVLENCNSVGLTIFMWALGGVLSIIGALAFTEIGVRYPVTGEKYAYLNILCGPYYAFAFMWQYVFLMRPGGNAIKALMCAGYLLKPFYNQSEIPNVVIQLVATLFTAIVTVMNCCSIKGTLRTQNVMICTTLLALVILSVTGFVELIRDNGECLENPFQNSESNPNKLVQAFTSTIFSYYGWSALNFLMEELKKPKRNLPLAIIISLLITTTLYVLVNISYISILGKAEVIKSEAVAMSVATKMFGAFGFLMSVMIAVTACSSFNSGLLVGSRLGLSGAREGHLPKLFALISIKYETPITSILLQSFCALVYIWLVDVYGIINNLVFCSVISDFVVEIAYIWLRIKEDYFRKQKTETLQSKSTFANKSSSRDARKKLLHLRVNETDRTEASFSKMSERRGLGQVQLETMDETEVCQVNQRNVVNANDEDIVSEENQRVVVENVEEKLSLKFPLFIHLSYGFLLMALITISLITNARSSAIGFGSIILVSSVYYIVVFVVKPKWPWFDRKSKALTAFVQKLFLCEM